MKKYDDDNDCEIDNMKKKKLIERTAALKS